jgi:hypothetical protein
MSRSSFLALLTSAALALFVVWTAAAPAFAAQAASAETMKFDRELLTIRTAKGATHKFTVELAASDAQLEFGLMYRKTMAADHGMLFDFGTPRSVMMWMKNTVLPLDMLFLDRSGTITHIAANAAPFSEAIISSDGPVLYVIELNAGIAGKLGLAVGDRVTSKTIASKAGK